MARSEISGQNLILNDREMMVSTSLSQKSRKNTLRKNWSQDSFENATIFSFSHLGVARSGTPDLIFVYNDGYSYFPPHHHNFC
jgi:nucleoside diphosphate kinase